MKHLLFIAFALGLFTNSFGQDLLVTAKGDTLRCKILSQTDQQIFISTLQPDGTPVSSYVSKDTIQTITPGYFGNGDLVGTSLDSPQANIQSPKKKKACKRWCTVCHFWWLQLTFRETGRGCNQQLQTRIYH